jgi:hypothetical protein
MGGMYCCHFFDPELYLEWQWRKRYAAQPEILADLNHVADRDDAPRHFLFGGDRCTTVVST